MSWTASPSGAVAAAIHIPCSVALMSITSVRRMRDGLGYFSEPLTEAIVLQFHAIIIPSPPCPLALPQMRASADPSRQGCLC